MCGIAQTPYALPEEGDRVERIVQRVMPPWESVFKPLCHPFPHTGTRKGGWRQQHNSITKSGKIRRSRVLEEHLRDWAEGVSSPVRSWRHMMELKSDGFTHPAVLRVCKCAKLETDGHHSKHFINMLRPVGLHDLISEVPGGGYVRSMIKPSTIFKLVYKSPGKFQKSFGADPIRSEMFWQNLFSTSQGMELRNLHQVLRGKNPTSSDLQYLPASTRMLGHSVRPKALIVFPGQACSAPG